MVAKNSPAQKMARIRLVLDRLRPLYASNPIEIDYETPFQLVVGTILSAQCTDVRVNKVTALFFPKFREAKDFARLTQAELEEMIKPTGFYRNKAKNILGAAKTVVERFGGRVPDSMAELTTLPGFGRKTANVILTALYHKNEGVCVDTHVLRLAKRLGLTKNTDAIRVEKDLMALTPQKNWHEITHFLILHGRRVCSARKPACDQCIINDVCPIFSRSQL